MRAGCHAHAALQVAQAPKASTPQVQAIAELELDQAWVPAQPGRNNDINLSLLTSCLLPSAQVCTAEGGKCWGDGHVCCLWVAWQCAASSKRLTCTARVLGNIAARGSS